MAKTLRYAALIVLAVAAWFVVAGEAGWIASDQADAVFPILLQAGGGLFLAGILFSALSPVSRSLRRGRCVRCGVTIERGQTYCADHLRATVNEGQDEAHRRHM